MSCGSEDFLHYWVARRPPTVLGMTQHDTPEQGFIRDGRSERESKTIWGHSLPEAAVCIGAGAAIALIAIFGQPG